MAEAASWDTLVLNLERNRAAPHIKLLIVRDHLTRGGSNREASTAAIAALLRAGLLDGGEGATLLEESQVPSPPASPPSETLSSEQVEVVADGGCCATVISLFDTPTFEHIKTYLDSILLLTTLMFGFCASFLISFGSDDLEAADARWVAWCTNTTTRQLPRMDAWCDGLDVVPADADAASSWTGRPSYVFGERAIWTYGSLSMAIALAWTQYICLLAFRLDTASDAVRARWWKLFQWPCHVAMGLFLVGASWFVYTLSITMRIVFTADIELLLAGASFGLWELVQTVGWIVAGVFLGTCALNLGMCAVWHRYPIV